MGREHSIKITLSGDELARLDELANGRPEAPIPVTASPFETRAEHPGKAEAADANGTNC